MRNLIEIKFENQHIQRDKFVIEGQDSFLRLCDGQEDIVDDVTWYAGLLTKNNDFVVNYSLDISETYNIQSPTDFTINILDDGLFIFLKLNNIDINKIQITYKQDSSVMFVGTLTNFSTSEDTITLTSTCVLKNLGNNIGETIFYGQFKNHKLTRDTTLSQEKTKFTGIDGNSRDYPQLVEYDAIGIGGLPRWNQGIFLYPFPDNPWIDKRTYIVVKYYNDVTFYIGSRVKFVQTYNSSNKDQVRYIKDFIVIPGVGYNEAIIYFDEPNSSTHNTLPSFDLSHMDQIEFFNDRKYFEIPNNPNTTNLKVYSKIVEDFKNINYEIEEIGNKTYIVIKPYVDVYTEIPIDKITHKSDDSNITHYDQYFSTSALTSKDMSNFYAWKNNTPESRTEEFIFESSAANTSLLTNLYFGMKSNIPSQVFNIGSYFTIKSINGKYYPSNNTGTIPGKDSSLNNYWKSGWGEGSFDINYYDYHGVPYFDNMTSGDSDAVHNFFTHINLRSQDADNFVANMNRQFYLTAFNVSEMYKFPDNFVEFLSNGASISLKLYYEQKQAYGYFYDWWPYIINKMMLISIDSFDSENLEEIYIDYYDPTIPEDLYSIKKDLLDRAGLIAANDSSIINTRFDVYSSESFKDALYRLSQLGFNICSDYSGIFYSNALLGDYSINCLDVKSYNNNNQSNTKYPSLVFDNIKGTKSKITLYNTIGDYPITQQEILTNIKDFWNFEGFDFLFENTYDSMSTLIAINSRILQPIFNICKISTSTLSKDIMLKNTYAENIDGFPPTLIIILEQCLQVISQKENIEITTTDFPVIGQIVNFNHPKFFNNSKVVGIVQDISINTLEKLNTLNIQISSIEYTSEDLSIYDQGAGSYDKYIDQGFSDKLILKDK